MHRKFIARSISLIIVFAALIAVPQSRAQFSPPSAQSSSALSIPQSDVIQVAEVIRLLKAAGGGKPLILQVGSHVMYIQAHIPGALYAGPGSQPGGLELLEQLTAQTQRNRLIVLYCGCCPWNRCPNVGPAYKRLHDLGYTNVKVLHLANNFGDDWVNKGYSVEGGQ
jgi:hypothetical protein